MTSASGSPAVIIDTDIGDDVDDAFALALAARLPHLRLRAVTTVAGPVKQRAQLARVILQAAGRSTIPVFAGESQTRHGRPGSKKFSHSALLDGRVEPDDEAPHGAVEQIIHTAQTEQLLLVCLGPLTNIAAALDHDATLAQRASVIAMAGKLGVPYPDWNIRCDPAAAQRVLYSGIAIRLVGMQLTMRCKLWPSQLQRLFAATDPLAQTLARCVLAWRTWKRRLPIVHDALAVAVAAEPSLVQWQARRVAIGLRGFSSASRCGPPNAQVATAVGLPRFHTLLDRTLFGPSIAFPVCQPLAWLTHHLA